MEKYIVFRLNDQKFGVKIKYISSIERIQQITSLPKSPSYIKGIINHRDQLTPIVDLKQKLNLAVSEPAADNRFLIVQMDGIQAGLFVDAATEVIDIPSTIIQPAPEMIGKESEVFIQGIARLENDLLTLIDIEQLLDFDEVLKVSEGFIE